MACDLSILDVAWSVPTCVIRDVPAHHTWLMSRPISLSVAALTGHVDGLDTRIPLIRGVAH